MRAAAVGPGAQQRDDLVAGLGDQIEGREIGVACCGVAMPPWCGPKNGFAPPPPAGAGCREARAAAPRRAPASAAGAGQKAAARRPRAAYAEAAAHRASTSVFTSSST